MTTKDQERKALEEIRAIVTGLGEESYIGKAFEGCFEMAEQNIDNDFWNSWKDKYEEQVKKTASEAKMADTLMKQVEELKMDLEVTRESVNVEKEKVEKITRKYDEAYNTAFENLSLLREQEGKVEALELENMKLKAKLYDMMVNAE